MLGNILPRLRRLTLLLACALMALAPPALAGQLTLDGAWIRWLPGDLPMGGYFRLHNGTDKSVRLAGVRAPDFARAMLHKSIQENGMDKMVHVESEAIAPGATLVFKPGGYHVMLMHRRHAIEQGQSLPITLEFAEHAPLTASFRVKSATGE